MAGASRNRRNRSENDRYGIKSLMRVSMAALAITSIAPVLVALAIVLLL